MEIEVAIGRYSTNEYFVKIGDVEAKLSSENFAKVITGMGGVMGQLREKRPAEQSIIKVNGVPFRCDCGCNVFTKHKGGEYTCNSCLAGYTGI